VLHARFAHNAPLLATQAAERGARKCPGRPQAMIDAILISTCNRLSLPRTHQLRERAAWPCVPTCWPWIWWARGLRGGGPAKSEEPPKRCWPPALPEGAFHLCRSFAARHFTLMTILVCLISACLFGDGAGLPPSFRNKPDPPQTAPLFWRAGRGPSCPARGA